MKCLKTLSLFFLFLFCFESENFIAQQTIDRDSVAYWSKLISSPEEEEDLAKVFLYFDKAKELSVEQNDTIGLIYHSSLLSVAEFDLGAYYESENSAISALKLVNETKIDEWNLGVVISLYNSLGKAHKELNDYENAIESYNNVLRLSNNLDDCIKAYNNKANVYRDESKLRLALMELSFANDLTYLNKDKIENARVLANLGFVQSKLENPNGIVNMLQALTTRTNENDLNGMFSSSIHLTEYYRYRDVDSALMYSNKALELSKKINSPIYKKEALSNLLKLEGNPKYVEYLDIESKLRESELASDIKFSHAKYNIEKERQRALNQRLLAEAKNKRQRLMFIGGGIILLLIAFFLYFFLRSKHKREKVQQVIKTETRISKKVHDELANGIHSVMTQLQRDLPEGIQENLIDELDVIYKKTRDISHDISAVSGGEKYHVEIKDMLGVYQKEDRVIMIKGLNPALWSGVAEHKKITLYHVLREMMVNMDKHSQAKIVIVAFKKEYKKIIINYMDNGIGFSTGNVSKGVGLQNAENRIKTIGGTCTFNSKKGKNVRVMISFPV